MKKEERLGCRDSRLSRRWQEHTEPRLALARFRLCPSERIMKRQSDVKQFTRVTRQSSHRTPGRQRTGTGAPPPVPPLATHGEDGRRQPPPPSTGRGRSAAPGLARANHRGPYHTPTLPTRLPHISAGGQAFEETGVRSGREVGGRKRVPAPWV